MGQLYTWNDRLFLSQKITSGAAKRRTQEWSLNMALFVPGLVCFLCSVELKDPESGNCILSPSALFFTEQAIPIFCDL